MKKILIVSTLLSLLFTSCFSPVFYNISKEVPPEQATVIGVINSLVRYKASDTEYLVVAANGGIRYKNAADSYHTTWEEYKALPFELHSFNFEESKHIGQSIIKVLADKDTLYIVSTSYKVDEDLGLTIPDVVSVYAKQISANSETGLWDTTGEWTNVASGDGYFTFSIHDDYVYSNFNSFCTNSVKSENRKAYIRCGSTDSYSEEYRTVKYFQLNGINPITEIAISSFESNNNIETKSQNINSAVVLNGQTIFFNTLASTTNETLEKDATYAYFGNSTNLAYTDGITSNFVVNNEGEKISCETPISCLAACSNTLLIGRGDYSDTINFTTGGITQIALDSNGILGNSLKDSDIGNTTNQLADSYIVLTLLNTDPSKTELESTLYASLGFAGSGSSTNSSVNYNRIGLWSYYPSRGNWNCE